MAYALVKERIMAFGPCSKGIDFLDSCDSVEEALDKASHAHLDWLAHEINKDKAFEADNTLWWQYRTDMLSIEEYYGRSRTLFTSIIEEWLCQDNTQPEPQ